eukprot:ctg_178.g138
MPSSTAENTATDSADAEDARSRLRSRSKRLRLELRRHAGELAAAGREVDAERLRALLAENDALAERVEEVPSHGMVTESFLKIALLQREMLARVHTGLRVLDAASLVRRLREVARSWRERGGHSDTEPTADAPPNAEEMPADEEEVAKDVFDWGRFGREYGRYLRTAPTMDFMVGPLGAPAPRRTVAESAEERAARRERQRAEREALRQMPVERPTSVTAGDAHQRTETDVLVKQMFDALCQQQRADFYRMLMDPNDFGHSVENLFHASFLIRDGRVKLTLEDGRPVLQAVSREEMEALLRGASAADGDAPRHHTNAQAVLRLDRAQWQRHREAA